MREIHVVALSDDGAHLVLATKAGATKGTHLLPVDERLAAALNGELNTEPVAAPAPPPEPPKPTIDSALTPKEIQARLRSGQSAQRVAKTAGVPVEWINKFIGPVLSERTRVVEAATAATMYRQRRGPSVLPLGESVAANLAEKGSPEPELADWDAFRRASGIWIVSVVTEVRGRSRTVQWSWDPNAKTLTGVDAYASALGYRETLPPRKRAAKKPASGRR